MADSFKGLRFLLIEDESMIAMLIEDMLVDLGCVVIGVATGVEDAIGRIASTVFDAAILDLNLNGRRSYPAAHALMEKSRPFLFSTGYGAAGVPEEFSRIPILTKPFQRADLERALSIVFEKHSGVDAQHEPPAEGGPPL